MKKQLQQLLEWHKKYGVFYRTEPDPFDDSEEWEKTVILRHRIMKEEIDEWKDSARFNEDIDKRVKELADILYTVFGTIVAEGMQDIIERALDAVHESNMSKGTNGKPVVRADGKILKGEDYKEPNLSFCTPPFR
jgi:predicted HAD superfamily Cof-like phosphohydrolase